MLIRSISLPVATLTGIAEFYRRVLGCTVIDSDRKRIRLRVGESRMTFVLAADAVPHHFACNIPPGTVTAARDRLAQHTPLQQTADGDDVVRFDDWDADAVYFLDPAGNIVEFIARAELLTRTPPHNPDPDPVSILNISEIGIAVPTSSTVRYAAAQIERTFGITPYRPISDDFAAMGSAQGLLILVPEGRPWFMGGGAVATQAPLRVEIAGVTGSMYIGAAELVGEPTSSPRR